MFSRISLSLRKVNACSLTALREVISNSYMPKPSTILMENIYDLKEWLAPYIYILSVIIASYMPSGSKRTQWVKLK